MDSPSVPTPPDPYVTANAQAGANKDAALLTAQLNRPNQYTPYGSLTWERGPGTRTFNQQRYDDAVKARQAGGGMASPVAPGGNDFWSTQTDNSGMSFPGGSPWKAPQSSVNGAGQPMLPDRNDAQFYDETPGADWSSRVTLDPRVQSILDAQLQTSQGLNTAIQSGLGRVNETFGKAAPTPDDAMRQRVEDALYQRHTSRLNPQFQQQEDQMRSTLMNRGLVEGSDAWKTQLDLLMRAKNDAYGSARQDAITHGGNEMARQYGMEMSGRNNVLNELNALRSGAQVTMPQFQGGQSGASVNPAPIAQAISNNYQGQMNQYNAEVGSNNAMLGGLFSLGGSVLSGGIGLPFM